MKYGELLKEIEKGRYEPVYLFVGEEDFLKEEILRKIAQALIDPSTQEFNYDLLYGGETDAATAVDIAASYPMMAERRLVIFRDIQNCSPKDRKVLLGYAAHPVQTTCLILIGPKVDLRKGFYKELSQAATAVVFWPLFDNQIPAWIRNRVHERGKQISPDALRVLQNCGGPNLRDLANEIDKLLIYMNDRKRIEKEDVEAVVGATKAHSVFDLAESVAEKRLDDSLQILHFLLESGESEVSIVWTLTRYFSTLAKVHQLNEKRVSADEIARRAKIRPFLVSTYLQQIRGLSAPQLERAFQLLLEADVNLKSSYQNPRLIMELLVYRLCRPSLK